MLEFIQVQEHDSRQVARRKIVVITIMVIIVLPVTLVMTGTRAMATYLYDVWEDLQSAWDHVPTIGDPDA